MTSNPRATDVVAAAPKQLLIGGKWVDASGGATFAVEDPATGETLCQVADATPEDSMRALDAAVAAQADWAATPPNERSEILYRAFQQLGERSDDLALLMTLEMGKSLAESKGEITYAAEFFRWFSGEALRLDGYYKSSGNGAEPGAGDAAADRALLLHHAVELPDRDGHPQDRPGDRRRLHDGRQAGPADAALDARPRRAARGVRPAAGRAQRGHRDLARAPSPSRSSRTPACASSASPAPPRWAGC